MPNLLTLAMGDFSRHVARLRRNSIFGIVVAILALTVYALLVAAGVIWLAQFEGLIAALLGGAAMIAALAFVIIAVAIHLDRRDRRRARASETRNLALATLLASGIKAGGRNKTLAVAALAGGLALMAIMTGKSSADRA